MKNMCVAVVRLFKIRRIIASTSLQNSESRMELDTHADTTVIGRNCLLIQDFNKTVSVTGWRPLALPNVGQSLVW